MHRAHFGKRIFFNARCRPRGNTFTFTHQTALLGPHGRIGPRYGTLGVLNQNRSMRLYVLPLQDFSRRFERPRLVPDSQSREIVPRLHQRSTSPIHQRQQLRGIFYPRYLIHIHCSIRSFLGFSPLSAHMYSSARHQPEFANDIRRQEPWYSILAHAAAFQLQSEDEAICGAVKGNRFHGICLGDTRSEREIVGRSSPGPGGSLGAVAAARYLFPPAFSASKEPPFSLFRSEGSVREKLFSRISDFLA